MCFSFYVLISKDSKISFFLFVFTSGSSPLVFCIFSLQVYLPWGERSSGFHWCLNVFLFLCSSRMYFAYVSVNLTLVLFWIFVSLWICYLFSTVRCKWFLLPLDFSFQTLIKVWNLEPEVHDPICTLQNWMSFRSHLNTTIQYVMNLYLYSYISYYRTAVSIVSVLVFTVQYFIFSLCVVLLIMQYSI